MYLLSICAPPAALMMPERRNDPSTTQFDLVWRRDYGQASIR